jgi:hypothetical protein
LCGTNYHHIADKRTPSIAAAGMINVGCQGPNTTGVELLLGVVQLRLAFHRTFMRLARQERAAKAIQCHNTLNKEPGYISLADIRLK